MTVKDFQSINCSDQKLVPFPNTSLSFKSVFLCWRGFCAALRQSGLVLGSNMEDVKTGSGRKDTHKKKRWGGGDFWASLKSHRLLLVITKKSRNDFRNVQTSTLWQRRHGRISTLGLFCLHRHVGRVHWLRFDALGHFWIRLILLDRHLHGLYLDAGGLQLLHRSTSYDQL